MHAFLIVGKNPLTVDKKAYELAKKIGDSSLNFNLQKISDCKNLLSFVKLSLSKPTSIIIKEIDKATIPALNAFLKTLEEPPPHTRIILTAITKHSMLSTIFSRCEVIDLGSGIEDLESITNNDIIFFNRYFDKSFFEQINNISAFDLDTWIKVWRKVLRAKILDQGASKTFSKLKTVEIKNYLKEILLVKAAMDKKVNQKLAFLKLMSDLLIFN